jgi:hypothetical protein
MYLYVSPALPAELLSHKYQGQVSNLETEKTARPSPHGDHPLDRLPHSGGPGSEARRLDRPPARPEAVALGGDQAAAGERIALMPEPL